MSVHNPVIIHTMRVACDILENYNTDEMVAENTSRFLSQLITCLDIDEKVNVEYTHWRKAFISTREANTRDALKSICAEFVCVPYTMRYPVASAIMKATVNLIQKKVYKIITKKDSSDQTHLKEVECLQDVLEEIANARSETLEQMLDRVEHESHKMSSS